MKVKDLLARQQANFLETTIFHKRLSIVFGLILLATTTFAQQARLTVDRKNTPIISILSEIEKSSGYAILYPEEIKTDLNQKVTISAANKSIEQVLHDLFAGTDFTYKIIGRQIAISGKKTLKKASVWNPSATQLRIQGKVTDAQSGEPLSNVNVFVKELGRGAYTNANGFFSLSLSEGTYTLKVSYIGYLTSVQTVNTNNGLTYNILLHSDTELAEVLVTAKKKDENVTRTNMGVDKLTISEIKRMPALMGEVDVIKAIQQLPGVQPTAEGGSGYSVRGGSTDQNLVMLDNATVYNASHMFGFFSVFNNDVVDNVELYKGDLPIKYGGRLSSLLDVGLKDSYTDKIKGSGGLGLISSRLMLEGSLGKNTNWMLGARRSYADLFLKLSSDKSINKSILYFYDLNAKMTHRLSDKDKLSLNLYSGSDKFGTSSVAEFSYGNRVGSLTWSHVYNERLISKLSFNATNYHYMLQSKLDNASIKWQASITDLALRWDWNHTLNQNLMLSYGATSTYHHFNPGFIKQPNYPNFKIPNNNALEHSAYLSAEHKLNDRLAVRYGLRLAVFQNVGSATVYKYDNNYEVIDSTHYGSGKIYHTYYRLEPRVGMVYKLSETSSIKANYARNTQFIQIANNSSSGSPLDLWFPASPNIKPQTADMISAGYFKNFNHNTFEFSTEVYYKKMNHVIDFADHATLLLNDKLDGEVRSGKGKSYGIELMLKKNTGRLTGFVNYTLSRSERTIPGINEGKTYLSPFDKTHSINLSASYELSKKWSISAAWVYATGNPTSYPTGRFEIGGEYFPIYSGRNEYRKKNYHRLDLSATYVPTHKPGRKWSGEWNFSLYNAYGQKNPWIITYDQNTPSGIPNAKMTYLFGIVPSITYNFKF